MSAKVTVTIKCSYCLNDITFEMKEMDRPLGKRRDRGFSPRQARMKAQDSGWTCSLDSRHRPLKDFCPECTRLRKEKRLPLEPEKRILELTA